MNTSGHGADAAEVYRQFVRESAEAIYRFELEEPVPVALPEAEQIARFYARGYLAECNDAFARQYGLPDARAAVGARLGDLMPRDDPQNAAYLSAFIHSGYRLTDAESVERDAGGNEKRFLNSLVGVVSDGALVRAWGTQRDVTAERERVRRLEEGEREQREFVDALPAVAWVADGTGKVLLYNRRWTEYTGLPADGDGVTEVLHPDDVSGCRATFAEAVRDGAAWEREYRLRRRDGAYRWFLGRAVPVRGGAGGASRWIGTAIDIEERKAADEALRARTRELRAAEELARTIAENSTQGFAMMDGRGYCTYANRAWREMTGYTDAEFRAKPLHYLVHHHRPDGRPYPMEDCPIDRALPENFDVRAHEDVFFRKDGTAFPVLVAASPIFKDGRPVSTVIEIRDVTEQKRVEANRRAFLREVLSSITEGRLRLCDRAAELPAPAAPEPLHAPVALNRATIRSLRRQASAAACAAGLPAERENDLITAVGEAAMNAVVHADGGEGRVYVDAARGHVQVWVTDAGAGISEETIHRAVLEKGYSSAGTLGHGFWLMLRTADRIHLLTGPAGTTVVLEQERAAPAPQWMADRP